MLKKKNDETEKPERSFMIEKTAERDASMNAAYLGVAASGALLVVGALAKFGVHTALAVGLGSVLAVANLWILERLVRVYLRSEKGRWAGVAVLKAAALFALVSVLVKTGIVSVLPLVLGFGALPFGIVVASLWPQPAAREEG
ncbi:MAG TPA: hypothetical protein VHE30_03615 [Polyangiaceae bacterium]|nr:hypothetical protein [Polyangiaceae bacterium]